MMEFVDPDLEWTNFGTGPGNSTLDRAGRDELAETLRLQASSGVRAELEEVIASGEMVMLVMRTPGLGLAGPRSPGDRTYDVVTVRDGLIVGLRACQDRAAARSLVGIG